MQVSSQLPINHLPEQVPPSPPEPKSPVKQAITTVAQSIFTISLAAGSWSLFNRIVLKEATNNITNIRNYFIPLALFFVANRIFTNCNNLVTLAFGKQAEASEATGLKKYVWKIITTIEDTAAKVDSVFSDLITKSLPKRYEDYALDDKLKGLFSSRIIRLIRYEIPDQIALGCSIRSYRQLKLDQVPLHNLTTLEIIREEIILNTVSLITSIMTASLGMRMCAKIGCHLPIKMDSLNPLSSKSLVPIFCSGLVGLSYPLFIGFSVGTYALSVSSVAFAIILGTGIKISAKIEKLTKIKEEKLLLRMPL